jgi:hypothetical protein
MVRATGEVLRVHERIDLRGAVPVRERYAIEETRVDVCEFLMVDRKDPRVFYCKLARERIDVAFMPCLLPPEDRMELCRFYRKYYADRATSKAVAAGR